MTQLKDNKAYKINQDVVTKGVLYNGPTIDNVWYKLVQDV